jgi:metal-responsive CopG/Arc/MetJ family transcriptional regulator
MRIAVSIPDGVFAEAESLAKQLRATRSEIYSRALRFTEHMNQVIASVGEEVAPFGRHAARRVLRRAEW